MKEIIERKLKELDKSYDWWLEKFDEHDDKYKTDRLNTIRSKMNVLREVLEIYESKNNSK